MNVLKARRIIISIGFLLIFLMVFQTSSAYIGKESKDDNLSYSSRYIIEYDLNTVICVCYPVTGEKEIDKVVKSRVLTLVEDFKQAYGKPKEIMNYDNNPYKTELNIDFKVEYIEDGLCKIKLSVCTDDIEHNTRLQHTEAMTFSIDSQRLEEYVYAGYDGDACKVREWGNGEGTIAGYRKIDPDIPMVALTFDDGPHSDYTIQILDALKDNNSAATFFVVGSRAVDNSDILKRMVREGSEIGNHSWNHKQLTVLKDYEVEDQISTTQKAIYSITGIYPRIMRPTYGSVDSNLQESLNLPVILWSVDPLDWKTQNTDDIVQHIMKNTHNGDIVLMHDIFPSTAAAAVRVIKELSESGFQLVTITELLSFKEDTLEAGKVYRRR